MKQSVFGDISLPNALTEGIFLGRSATGVACTNVEHLVVQHSPTGYNFGYAGSGPADLALNICEIMLNRLGYQGERIECFDGDCWDLAFELHQKFKVEFIASVDQGHGGVIPYADVLAWFQAKLPQAEAASAT